MGFAVLHLDKAAGSDSAMSSHIERRIAPQNADEKRTHLNRELIEFPTGVENRTQAIQHRLDTAGITRKISKNQVKAIRVLLSGSPEDMKRIEHAGRLDAWCRDNLDWLQRTFGRANVVSAVLHMDETTPHIHATVVPIVRGERRKAAQQQAKNSGKRTYRKKKDAPRLCADDVMSRPKLKEYQTSYAECVARYGLQRGIDGSEAKHITCSQFYKEVFLQQSAIAEKVENMKEQRATLSVDIAALQTQQAEAQADYHIVDEDRKRKRQELQAAEKALEQTRRSIKTDKLKGAAVDTTIKAVERIGSLFHDPKPARYEQQIVELRGFIADKEQENGDLQQEIRTLQADHTQEREQLKQDAANIRSELTHVHELFPQVRGLMIWEKYCRYIGLTLEWIKALFTLQPYQYTGSLTSTEFKRAFHAQDATLQFKTDKDGPGGYRLTINGKNDSEWFQQQRAQQIKRITGIDIEQRPKIKIDRGINH